MRVPASGVARRLALGIHLLLVLAAVSTLSACMGDDDRPDDTPASPGAPEATAVQDAGPIHVHALGVNPKDGSLFLATHTGLFHAARPGAKPKRVADRWQDTMGFTVIGPDHFLGSGHPDGREQLPPFLGLIESRDAGRTWREISLQGAMDFHVLEADGDRIYGFGSEWETNAERLLVSNDRGETWWRRRAPESLIDLAIAPDDPDTAVAAGRRRLYITRDAAQTWSELSALPGLLAWSGRQLIAIDARGAVRAATAAFRGWRIRGRVGGEPAALAPGRGRQLYVALHDGTIKHSGDGGFSWSAWGGHDDGHRTDAARPDERPATAEGVEGSQETPDEPPNRSHESLRDVPDDAEAK
jgi:hypothetical protein